MPSTFSVIACVVLCFSKNVNAFASPRDSNTIHPLKEVVKTLTWNGPPGISTSFDLTG